ncbi:hypothetical protein [Brevibacillus dissolubilis]|uniref:hypothetical protein n=1 Tax=Brevibacillus dissolubilis TaxID=1844116 RepID=UPI0011172C09|nr:hypothetical protein [Brevibacillus dissolubilis]
MEVTRDLIPVTTIADFHLEDFLHSPKEFLQKHVLKKGASALTWQQLAQATVNQVVRDYHKLPPDKRHAQTILEMVQRYWVKKVEVFESHAHYYMVLAQITDHLLQFLLPLRGHQEPVLLHERLRVYSEEVQVELSMTFQVMEWSEQSFVIRKYIVKDDAQVWDSYRFMTTLFCAKAFQQLPEKIEVYSMLSGNVYQCQPSQDDIGKAVDYVHLAKHALQETRYYAHKHVNTEKHEPSGIAAVYQ